MQININRTYKFVFISDPPDGHPDAPTDGYYLVLQELTYNELLEAGIDTYPVSSYQNLDFYKLKNQSNNQIVYVPESYIAEFPEIDVQRYPKLVMTINLGLVNNPSVLDGLKEQIAGTINNLDCALFAIPWVFGDSPNEVTISGLQKAATGENDIQYLTVTDTSGLSEGMAADHSPNVVKLGTKVTEVVDGTTLKLNRQFYVPSYVVTAYATAPTDQLVLDSVEGISVDDYLDENVSGIDVDTWVSSIDSAAKTITLNKDITSDISPDTVIKIGIDVFHDGDTLIIDNAENSQPEFGIDACSLMTFDYVWMSSDEAKTQVKEVQPLQPNPYKQISDLKTENSRLRAQVAALEELLGTLPST